MKLAILLHNFYPIFLCVDTLTNKLPFTYTHPGKGLSTQTHMLLLNEPKDLQTIVWYHYNDGEPETIQRLTYWNLIQQDIPTLIGIICKYLKGYLWKT